ncbi:MAG: hypothetical protein MZU95_11835 [Desulfomicrobium escambiense]|nr:hypothetical protein [Desulfomicrobium escambiense]
MNFADAKFAPFLKAYEAKYGEAVQTYHTVFGYDDHPPHREGHRERRQGWSPRR